MQRIMYVFDCPIHGEEDQVFCFRAGDPKLRSQWRRYKVTRVELPILVEEVIEAQRQLRDRGAGF